MNAHTARSTKVQMLLRWQGAQCCVIIITYILSWLPSCPAVLVKFSLFSGDTCL